MTVRTIVANFYAAERRFSRLRQSADLSHVICTALILFTWADISVLAPCCPTKLYGYLERDSWGLVYGGPFPGSNFDESGYFDGARGGR